MLNALSAQYKSTSLGSHMHAFCRLKRLLLKKCSWVRPTGEWDEYKTSLFERDTKRCSKRAVIRISYITVCMGWTLRRVQAVTYVIWLLKGLSWEEMEVRFLHCRPSRMTHWSVFPGAGWGRVRDGRKSWLWIWRGRWWCQNNRSSACFTTFRLPFYSLHNCYERKAF